MEESEKRRERLKAMRMEAAKADISIDSESSGIVSRSLSNPLIEKEPAPSTAIQYSRPRFDYYTDPMSAFSSDKRRNNFSHEVSQVYSSIPPNMTSSRPNYPYMTSSSGQRPTQLFRDYHSQSSSAGTPMGAAGPLGIPQGNTSNTWGGPYSNFNYSYSPNMPDVNFPNSGVGRAYSPHAVHVWGGDGRYSNSPRTQPHSHRDSQHGGSHYSDWRRGRSQSQSGNSNAGWRPGGRGRKVSQDPVSAELRPDLYYDEEMLEDPWKGMTPVIWKGPKSDSSWVPKSIGVKKARPSPEASHKSISQPSLAEYLATLNDTVNEPTHEEHEHSEVNES